MISLEKIQECERLYKEGNHTIKQIMSITGIRSEQTVYRILDSANIPRRPSRKTCIRATVSFDKNSAEIIRIINPKSLSEWICGLIKSRYGDYLKKRDTE